MGAIGERIKRLHRPFYFLVAVALFGISISEKLTAIEEKSNRPMYSFYKQHKREGFPVSILRLNKKRVYFYEQATLCRISKRDYFSWVDAKFQKKIVEGAGVIFEDKNRTYKGRVTSIGRRLDYNHPGLYRVNVRFNKKIKNRSKWINAKIVIASKKTIALKNEYIDCFQNECFAWILKDGTPHKIKIETGIFDDRRTEIISGLKNRDTLITSDARYLSEGIKTVVFNDADK